MAVFGIVRVAIDERQHHHDGSWKADWRAVTCGRCRQDRPQL